MTEFERLWMAQPRQCGKLLQAMTELRRIYDERTEAYDQTVCTGRTSDGTAMPQTAKQSGLINRNALKTRDELLTKFCHTYDVTAETAIKLWQEVQHRPR